MLAGKDAEELNSHSLQVGMNVVWLPWKTAWLFLVILACTLPKTQQLCSWAFITEKSKLTCTEMLYVNAHNGFLCKSQKTGNNPSFLQWVKGYPLEFICRMGPNAPIKRNKPMVHAAAWMDPRGILLGGKCQPEKALFLKDSIFETFWKWPQRWRAGQWLPGDSDGADIKGQLEGLLCDCDCGVGYRDYSREKTAWDTHTHTHTHGNCVKWGMCWLSWLWSPRHNIYLYQNITFYTLNSYNLYMVSDTSIKL